MKLDKIRFAQVVAFIGRQFDTAELSELDNLIDISIPDPVPSYPDASDINNLMKLMADGKEKISAIKLHRKLTGYGLKESKDEVEKYWPNQNWHEYFKNIQDALGTAETGADLIVVARNAHRAEQELASQHNEPTTLGDILSDAVRARYQDG